MRTFVRTALVVCGLISFGLTGVALADGGGGSAPVKRVDPDFAKAERAIKDQNFAAAIALLQGVIGRDSENADAFNLLGFAERKSGHLEQAFGHYERALALDPKHRGAHEYIGEAYLMADNLPKAEEHLARLDQLCFFSCEEYRDLKSAIADYRAKHSPQ